MRLPTWVLSVEQKPNQKHKVVEQNRCKSMAEQKNASKAVEQKLNQNARWPSKKMQDGRAKAKPKM
jgi:hypothetical protein